jgi:hypothetical protein
MIPSRAPHRPASHPVLRHYLAHAPAPLPLSTPADVARYTAALDELARAVWELPHQAATIQHARLLNVIATELLRRAQ